MGLVLIAGITLGLLDRSFRRGQLKGELESACSGFLQRPLTIKKIDGIQFRNLIIVARDVKLLDDDKTVMIECAKVSLKISPRSLLHFKIVIEKIIFSEPTIRLKTGEEQKLNINRMVADIHENQQNKTEPPQKIFSLRFKHFVIENGHLTFGDPPTAKIDFKGALNIKLDSKFDAKGGLTGAVNLASLMLGLEEFTDVSARFKYKSDLFSIESIKAAGLGGTLEGAIQMQPSQVDIQMKAVDIQAQNLFNLFNSSLEVTGLCQLDGHLTSGWGDEFISKANGEIDLEMKDGHLPEVPVVLRTLSAANVLSLVNYLKGKKNEKGLPVNTAQGKIKIENGKASPADDPFLIENDLLQMGFRGTVDLVERNVDGDVVIHILTLPDEIIGAVPGLKFILLGKSRSFFPIYVRVKGPLKDPKVNTQSLKSITGPVWQTLNRIFRLPKDLIDKLK